MYPLLTSIVLVADLVIRIGLTFRLVMRRRPVGVTFAWLAVILSIPIVGAILYLAFGELRLGNRRADYAKKIHEPFEAWLTSLEERHEQVDWSKLGVESEPLARLTQALFGIPSLPGNRLQLIAAWEDVFRSMIADIEAAKRTCHFVFYIWNDGGMADELLEAVVRAADRGVICRILVDDLGSRDFLRGPQAQKLRDAGVQVVAALPVGLIRSLFYRVDLRMHRKIVVIDGEIAYTGSLNLVDPRFFQQDKGVGQWVDAMVRVEGPAVESLGITFLEDWELERGEGLDRLQETGDVHNLPHAGTAVVQTIPSGPVFESRAVQDVLLMLIYAARREIILTSPYFVPDEVLATALATAARRGVDVTVIVPAKNNHLLVQYASQAFKGDLMQAGVKIAQFDGGLLHTKSATVDGEFSHFGSLNLDPRSLHLNFEITLAVYDADFTNQLRKLQQSYIEQSTWMDLAKWQSRPLRVRLLENTLRLLSPLL